MMSTLSCKEISIGESCSWIRKMSAPRLIVSNGVTLARRPQTTGRMSFFLSSDAGLVLCVQPARAAGKSDMTTLKLSFRSIQTFPKTEAPGILRHLIKLSIKIPPWSFLTRPWSALLLCVSHTFSLYLWYRSWILHLCLQNPNKIVSDWHTISCPDLISFIV